MSKKLIYLLSFILVLSLASNALAELVAHWRFDEGSGTIASDTSGNGNDGTVEGDAKWVAGRIGSSALSFDHSDDIVIVDYDPSLDIEDALTISLWVNAPDVVTPNHMVTKQPSGTAGNNYPGNYEFRIKDNTIQFLHQTSAGTDYSEYHSSSEITAGEWHHAAVSIVEGDFVEFYLDGVPAGSVAQLGTFGVLNDDSLRIGGRKDSRFFNGILDDVYIYARALTLDQIVGLSEGIEPTFRKAENPSVPDSTIFENTWANLTWTPGDAAVSHDVYIGENFDDVSAGAENTFVGNQAATFIVVGFLGFPFPDGLVPGTTYYWRIDEVNDTEPNSPWKGHVWSFSIPPKTAYFPDPENGAESVNVDVQLSWTGGFDSKLHTVYFGDNFDDVNNASGGLPQGSATFTPGTLQMAGTYYWRVDEFDAVDTFKGEVWSFLTQGAVGSPEPANGVVDLKQTQIITWSPSVFAASHEVYFGSDEDAVKNADTGSPEYKGTRALGSESYDPGILEWDTTYYWRIDEANNTNPDSPWTGILWSFTTANFLIVDDFEDYDVGNNEIWWSWIDGLGYASHPTLLPHPGNGTGSMVGDETTGSYMEETIVHGGGKSMPVFYDNNQQGKLKYSEVEMTLTYPREWTENGVSTLSIWFRGNSDNAAETLYVVLNGSAVVDHDNPDVAQITTWTQWNIDLQAFADQVVNLANVNTIALGLGNRNNPLAGGSGTMYFDDIRLYPPPPEPAP